MRRGPPVADDLLIAAELPAGWRPIPTACVRESLLARLKEVSPMDDMPTFTNRCACGWEVSGSESEVVDATIDHGRRIHDTEATRGAVIAALHEAATTTDATNESAAG